MKKFFSEYGWLIAVGAIVILMLMFTTPFGQAVTGSIASFVNGFTHKTSASIDSVKIAEKIKKYELVDDADGNGTISKGDLIMLERDYVAPASTSGDWIYEDASRTARVLSWDGTYAKLAFIEESEETYAWYDDNATAETFLTSYEATVGGTEETYKYSGSNIDIYCENTFQNMLSVRARMDIVSKSLVQNVYSRSASDGAPATPNYTGPEKAYINGNLGLITRNVHALSIEDIKEYFEGRSYSADDVIALYDQTGIPTYHIHLMAMCQKGSDRYSFIVGNQAASTKGIARNYTTYEYHVVPVLTMNLN